MGFGTVGDNLAINHHGVIYRSIKLPGTTAGMRAVMERLNADIIQPGIVDEPEDDPRYGTSTRVASCSFCRAIKRTETVNERATINNTRPNAGWCICIVSNNGAVFNDNIAQNCYIEKITGNHTGPLPGRNISPGKPRIVNSPVVAKPLDKAVPEFINGLTTTVVFTNKWVGCVADRTGQVTSIDIGKLAIMAVQRIGRIATDFAQSFGICYLDPSYGFTVRCRYRTGSGQAGQGTQPNSCSGQPGRLMACPVPLFFPGWRLVLVVPAGDVICSQRREIAAKPTGNCQEVRRPPDTGNNSRRQTDVNTDHPGRQLGTLQYGVIVYFRRIGAECRRLHLYGTRRIIRMEYFEKRDNASGYADSGTTI